jgi:poly-gamma-glutamate capsule biosynthesis protein CapA/YwtB (metallophosphatase superfamily)
MQVIIAGDVVPTKSNESLFNNGDTISLLGSDLNNLWASSDIRVLNLEVPLTDHELPISKWGPNLIAPISTIKGIKKLNPSLVTLANNHILDQGIHGLHSTETLLRQYDIPFVGVGENLQKASEPVIIKRNGVTIGVYACTENEFTIATDKNPGANPFDPLESPDHIATLKSKCDYVIVLYHGGKEHYRYPSPDLQKTCRKLAEKGADIVICQHSHCVGCFEKYLDSTIVYGQGNFIFDSINIDFWQTSILVNINITNKLSIEYIPIVKSENVVRLANDNEAKTILNNFHARSVEICKEGFIQEQYQKFAEEKLEGYLRTLSGLGKWISRIDRRIFKGQILRYLYKKRDLLAIQNFIECEAHRELLLKGLKGVNNSG